MRTLRFLSTNLIIFHLVSAQTKTTGVVLDEETKHPIAFVDVFSGGNHTLTNEDGRFEIEVFRDTLNFNIIGYEPFSKSYEGSPSIGDTIFLKSKFLELEEVVISEEAFPLGDYITIGNNHSFEPFSEAFFLRISLKKDSSLLKLQDISGLMKRKQLLSTRKNPKPKNNVEVEITNMRKAAKEEKEIYFKMWGFNEIDKILSSIAINPKYYHIEDYPSASGKTIKLFFKANTKHDIPDTEGYYIIDSEDKAIQEFYLIEKRPTDIFDENWGVKYRTILFELNVHFEKDFGDKLYYVDKAKINARVELYDKENLSSAPIIYDASYLWVGLNLVDNDINKNVSSNKDLFKLDFPYNEAFWRNQKTLLLTDEMNVFVNELNSSKEESQFISNMK
ncbi:carboxypeptidase-like regulatory domain-containing protein [Allomuricauda sp. SCSIO 65647]|uniref:carboxypeptidase-like regulatory domain-containing protein n=1 Tax=Allomuricauda sp. SCSIO 65647 TaxID=2908843 RepID=UPI001F429F9E|nr:carboxypeptidase-like regulatory domain-containing protein [Muricauda sp. SCSIO 65647]UJH68197.1 carboxypeptidase-like regulatory domain-containing protein [Muricauda sp. SCSIO 65647]